VTQTEVEKLLENQREALARAGGPSWKLPVRTTADMFEIELQSPQRFLWDFGELPPSNNDLVRPAVLGMHRSKTGKMMPTVRLVKTKEATEWMEAARESLARAARQQRHRLFQGVPVRMTLDVVVPSIASDATNRLKALEDACKGIVWGDDIQVVEATARKHLAADLVEGTPLVRLCVEQWSAGAELTKRLAKSKGATVARTT
jgi:Holliday junction resolvase RusA-like endonuclease